MKLRRFFPLVKSYPNRGDFEIKEFTKPLFIESLARTDIPIKIIPLILFVDSFNLYRAIAKLIIGIYIFITIFKRINCLK